MGKKRWALVATAILLGFLGGTFLKGKEIGKSVVILDYGKLLCEDGIVWYLEYGVDGILNLKQFESEERVHTYVRYLGTLGEVDFLGDTVLMGRLGK